MLPALELCDRRERRRQLLHRWRAEETSLREALHELQTAHDRSVHAAQWQRQVDGESSPALLRHIRLLAQECDDMATELLHVRLALQGLELELDAPFAIADAG